MTDPTAADAELARMEALEEIAQQAHDTRFDKSDAAFGVYLTFKDVADPAAVLALIDRIRALAAERDALRAAVEKAMFPLGTAYGIAKDAGDEFVCNAIGDAKYMAGGGGVIEQPVCRPDWHNKYVRVVDGQFVCDLCKKNDGTLPKCRPTDSAGERK